jgi:hypothetical protein
VLAIKIQLSLSHFLLHRPTFSEDAAGCAPAGNKTSWRPHAHSQTDARIIPKKIPNKIFDFFRMAAYLGGKIYSSQAFFHTNDVMYLFTGISIVSFSKWRLHISAFAFVAVPPLSCRLLRRWWPRHLPF